MSSTLKSSHSSSSRPPTAYQAWELRKSLELSKKSERAASLQLLESQRAQNERSAVYQDLRIGRLEKQLERKQKRDNAETRLGTYYSRVVSRELARVYAQQQETKITQETEQIELALLELDAFDKHLKDQSATLRTVRL